MGERRVRLYYQNWKGECSYRTIIPFALYFGSTEYHPEPQFLLQAWDCDKNDWRTFAMSGISLWAEVEC